MTAKPQPPDYREEDFPAVPDGLKRRWEAMVKHDLTKNPSQNCYQEWQLFSRFAFAPWHIADEVFLSTNIPVPANPRARLEEVINHGCGVLGENFSFTFDVTPHLLRRKTTVANYVGPAQTVALPGEKPPEQYFSNFIEHALYMLYLPYTKRQIADVVQRKSAEAAEDDIYDEAMKRLKYAVAVRYDPQHETTFPIGLKNDIARAGSRVLQNRRYTDKEHNRRTKVSIQQEFAEDRTFEALLGAADNQAIRFIATAEAITMLLNRTTGLLSPREDAVLRIYCNNAVLNLNQDAREMGEPLGMQSNLFGATLNNALKKIRNDPTLRKLFEETLSETRGR